MKMKKIGIVLTLALAVGFSSVAMAATPSTTLKTASTTKTLTRAEAIKKAQEKAKGTVLKTELDRDDDKLIYEIEILDTSNVKHEMDINARTGKLSNYSKETIRKSKADKLRSAKISPEKAVEIVQKEADGSTTLVSCELDIENNLLVYEIKLVDSTDKDNEYEAIVSASTGKILFFENDYDD